MDFLLEQEVFPHGSPQARAFMLPECSSLTQLPGLTQGCAHPPSKTQTLQLPFTTQTTRAVKIVRKRDVGKVPKQRSLLNSALGDTCLMQE